MGCDELETFDRLRKTLERDGLKVEMCGKQSDLLSVLHDGSRLVVVFYGNSSEAEELFAALRSQYRPIPIVVLTATPSCGDYYRLSWVAPTYFCAEIDQTEPIRRTINRAVASAA